MCSSTSPARSWRSARPTTRSRRPIRPRRSGGPSTRLTAAPASRCCGTHARCMQPDVSRRRRNPCGRRAPFSLPGGCPPNARCSSGRSERRSPAATSRPAGVGSTLPPDRRRRASASPAPERARATARSGTCRAPETGSCGSSKATFRSKVALSVVQSRSSSNSGSPDGRLVEYVPKPRKLEHGPQM